jgi:hypothetical protein
MTVSMRARTLLLSLPLAVCASLLAGCGGSGSTGSSQTLAQCQDAGAALPATLHLTVSGFSTCTCFNGTFTLTQEQGQPADWTSQAITGCPGQQDTAYLKFADDVEVGSNPPELESGLGITDQTSDPGSGNSDFAPTQSVTCSPLSIHGGGSQAGNINAFCPGAEDENMSWTLTP